MIYLVILLIQVFVVIGLTYYAIKTDQFTAPVGFLIWLFSIIMSVLIYRI